MRDPYPYPRFENDDNFAEGKQKQVKHHFHAPTQRVAKHGIQGKLRFAQCSNKVWAWVMNTHYKTNQVLASQQHI